MWYVFLIEVSNTEHVLLRIRIDVLEPPLVSIDFILCLSDCYFLL